MHTLNELIDFINIKLMNSNFENQETKIWIWESKCAVLDFKIRRRRFAFHLTPHASNLVDLDFVPRKGKFTENFTTKKNLAAGVPLAELWPIVVETLEAAVGRRALKKEKISISEPAKSLSSFQPSTKASLLPSSLPTTRPRVGILTLPLNKNFGGNLQAFALADTLNRLGAEPVLLNRRRDVTQSEESVLSKNFRIPNAPTESSAFLAKYIPSITGPIGTSDQLDTFVRALGLHAVVVGSDQVWRPKYAQELLPDFFLTGLTQRIRKLSYAASFGADTWEYTPDQQAMGAQALARFDAISCREDIGVQMCAEHLGAEAAHVLDPTLLVPRLRYEEVTAAAGTSVSAGQIVSYVLDANRSAAGVIASCSERLGLRAFSTDGKPYSPRGALKKLSVQSTLINWIASLGQAGLVVTDSFHGMVFATIFNRPFIVFANAARGLARFTSFLRVIGLEDRLVQGDRSPDLDQLLAPIDWESVNARLDAARATSLAYLREALALPKTADPVLPEALPVETAWTEQKAGANPPVLCTGCGSCVDKPDDMEFGPSGFLQPKGGKIDASALHLCPFNPLPTAPDEDALGADFLGEAPHHHSHGGHYRAAFIGHSNALRMTSSSGGIASWIFERLLRGGEVGKLFVVTGGADGRYRYASISDPDEILTISKTRYYPVSLAGLYQMIAQSKDRVAISGVACFVKSVRLRQQHDPELREKIAFIAGIICGGLKSSHYSDFLASAAGIKGPHRDADYREKNVTSDALDYLFSASPAKGERKKVRMRRLGDMWGSGLFKAKACDFCTDVTTELGDISLGDAWLPEHVQDGRGTSVVVTRSDLADRLIRVGIARGELSLTETTMDRIVRSQQGGFNHKRKTLEFRVMSARQHADYRLPHLRTRVLTPVSASEAVVQLLRERVRSKSHRIWAQTGDYKRFVRRMIHCRTQLKTVTQLRDKRAKEIRQLANDFLAGAASIPALQGDLAALMPIARWLRRNIAAGRTSPEEIRSLVQL